MGVSQGQLVYAVVTSTSQVSVAYSTFPRNQPRALVHAIVIGSQALTDRTTITWNTAAQCNRGRETEWRIVCGLLKLPLGRDSRAGSHTFLAKASRPHLALSGYVMWSSQVPRELKMLSAQERKQPYHPLLCLGHPTLPLSRVDVLGALCGDAPDMLLLLLFARDRQDTIAVLVPTRGSGMGPSP